MRPYGLITEVRFDKTKAKKAKGTDTKNMIKAYKTSERSFVKLQIIEDVIEHYSLDITRNHFKNSCTKKADKRRKVRTKNKWLFQYRNEIRARMKQAKINNSK